MRGMGRKMRVVHCFRAPVGGLFRHVRDLARGQAELGCAVGILCDSTSGGAFAESALTELESVCALGVERTPMSRLLSAKDIAAVRAIAAYCREAKPDILHGHGAKGGAYARLLAARFGARAVYTPHGGSLHYSLGSPGGLLFLGLEKALRRRTDGFLFESDFSAACYADKVGAPGGPARIVPNGLADEEFDSLPEATEFDFVFIGELRRLKGVDLLIAASAKIVRDRPIRVLVAGDGPDRGSFAEQILAAGLERSIVLSDPIYPARAAFEKARCVVVPSRAEAFPYVVLEAAAAGRPIVASRVGGIPEIVGEDAKCLFPSEDVSALARTMTDFLDRPDKWRKEAVSIKERCAARFRLGGMVRAISSFYGEVLGEPRGEAEAGASKLIFR